MIPSRTCRSPLVARPARRSPASRALHAWFTAYAPASASGSAAPPQVAIGTLVEHRAPASTTLRQLLRAASTHQFMFHFFATAHDLHRKSLRPRPLDVATPLRLAGGATPPRRSASTMTEHASWWKPATMSAASRCPRRAAADPGGVAVLDDRGLAGDSDADGSHLRACSTPSARRRLG